MHDKNSSCFKLSDIPIVHSHILAPPAIMEWQLILLQAARSWTAIDGLMQGYLFLSPGH